MTKDIKQPTYKRQRFLLAFIRQLEANISATDLQKLVFLSLMKENLDFYEFIPYKYGAYSFQLAEDLNILQKDGYLLQEASNIHTLGEIQQNINLPISRERGEELRRTAYRAYPYYTINSEILGRLFDENEVEIFRQAKKEYIKTGQVLFTIGYEGKTVEAFTNSLIQNNVRMLIDVRKNPLSRKFGFSKGRLQHIMETVGIKYSHIPDLGIESDKRCSLKTMDDYKYLFSGYKETLSNYLQQLRQLYSLLSSNERVALVCFEKEPGMCHRHVLRDYLVDTYGVESIDL